MTAQDKSLLKKMGGKKAAQITEYVLEKTGAYQLFCQRRAFLFDKICTTDLSQVLFPQELLPKALESGQEEELLQKRKPLKS
jgi:hypothetical protein